MESREIPALFSKFHQPYLFPLQAAGDVLIGGDSRAFGIEHQHLSGVAAGDDIPVLGHHPQKTQAGKIHGPVDVHHIPLFDHSRAHPVDHDAHIVHFFPVEDLKTLRKLGSYLQGHPCMQHTPGIDMSSGSLGQGISAAVGMALSAKMSGDSYRTYTLLGDGEIQEGQVWEAAMFAGARKLDNLVVIVDNNGLQIDGPIDEVNSPYPIDKKFEAFNFHVINVADGNDFDQLKAAFDEAKATKGMPTAIIAKTLKGKGVSFMEGQVGWHGKAPNDEEYAIAMADLEKAGEALCQK